MPKRETLSARHIKKRSELNETAFRGFACCHVPDDGGFLHDIRQDIL
jgi:hypothetical protein